MVRYWCSETNISYDDVNDYGSYKTAMFSVVIIQKKFLPSKCFSSGKFVRIEGKAEKEKFNKCAEQYKKVPNFQ